jgi:hypothetical protein
LSRSEATRYNAYAGFGDQFGGNTFGWRFGTVNNSTDYPTLYMINGSVGIATPTTPVSPLQVNATNSMASSGSVADILALTNNDGVTNGVVGARIGLTISAQSNIADRRIGIYATSNAANYNTPDITFWASAQGVAYRELVRISAANGYLGVGTGANPSAKLHLYETAAADVALRLTPYNGSYDALLQMTGQGNEMSQEGFEIWYVNQVGDVHLSTTYPNDAAAIRFHTRTGSSKSTSNERLTIAGNGNVGVGQSSPNFKLDVNGDIRSNGVTLNNAFSYNMSGNYSAGTWYNITDTATMNVAGVYICLIYADTYAAGQAIYFCTGATVPFYWWGVSASNNSTAQDLPQAYGTGHAWNGQVPPQLRLQQDFNANGARTYIQFNPLYNLTGINGTGGRTLTFSFRRIG